MAQLLRRVFGEHALGDAFLGDGVLALGDGVLALGDGVLALGDGVRGLCFLVLKIIPCDPNSL
jgi:hypothetical protein